jgi:hypothetical protein
MGGGGGGCACEAQEDSGAFQAHGIPRARNGGATLNYYSLTSLLPPSPFTAAAAGRERVYTIRLAGVLPYLFSTRSAFVCVWMCQQRQQPSRTPTRVCCPV